MFDLPIKEKKTLWNQYLALFDAKQKDPEFWTEKHYTRVLTNLMACRDFSWHVVGITRKALEQYSKSEFRRTKKDGITRGHIIPRRETARKVMELDEHLSLDKFFEIWLANDKTVLCAKGENKKVLPPFIAFENNKNLFNCKDMLVGHRHQEQEINFLRNLYLNAPNQPKQEEQPALSKLKRLKSHQTIQENDISLWYETLKKKILGLDRTIDMVTLDNYDSYKTSSRKSFADIKVQKQAIKIQVSRRPKYSDPKSMLTQTNDRWTLGYHLYIKDENHIDDALSLIKQSLDYVGSRND